MKEKCMIRFFTTIILLLIAFFVGKNWAGELANELVQTVKMETISFNDLSNQEIIALIRTIRLQENGSEKYAKLQILLALLNDRLGA